MKKRRIYGAIIIVILAVIWGNSCMPPDVSSSESGFAAKYLLPVIKAIFGEKLATEYFIRKLAHFTEYAALGFFLLRFAETFRELKFRTALQCLNTAFICAAMDETIQIFSSRGSTLKDVWLDTAGALFGILLSVLFSLMIKKIRKKS